MPTYYFNVSKDKGEAIIDEVGTDLSDLRAAIFFAILSARSHAADDVLRGRFRFEDQIDIVDGAGVLLHTIGFDEAVGMCS